MKDYEILEQKFIDGGIYCLKSMQDKTAILSKAVEKIEKGGYEKATN